MVYSSGRACGPMEEVREILSIGKCRVGEDLATADVVGTGRMGSMVEPGPAEAGLRYVARQPILDADGRAQGYELLFRDAPTAGFAGDGEVATRTMLDNLVLFNPGRFTGGKAAFINCTEATLMSGLVGVVGPETTVLEVLETVTPTPELVERCRALKMAGYRLALDDFTWRAGVEPLAEMADYIKVDFLQSGAEERREIRQRLRGCRAALVAEKLETQADFEQAKREGFALFQGYYFCRPELLASRAIPANLLVQMELLEALQREGMDFPEMARLVKRDPGIAYRLLRMVNSAAFGMRWEVRSVEMALVTVGEGRFRQIAMLAIAAALCPSHAWEALRMALVRGRFCELSAELMGGDATEQYLLGLLSLLPAMMQVPMAEAVAGIQLRGAIRRVLLGECNEEGWLLRWMEHYEEGDWKGCDGISAARGLDAEALKRNLREAVVWADAMLHPIG